MKKMMPSILIYVEEAEWFHRTYKNWLVNEYGNKVNLYFIGAFKNKTQLYFDIKNEIEVHIFDFSNKILVEWRTQKKLERDDGPYIEYYEKHFEVNYIFEQNLSGSLYKCINYKNNSYFTHNTTFEEFNKIFDKNNILLEREEINLLYEKVKYITANKIEEEIFFRTDYKEKKFNDFLQNENKVFLDPRRKIK